MDALMTKVLRKGNEWIKRNINKIITVTSVVGGTYYGYSLSTIAKRPELLYDSMAMGAIVGLMIPLSLLY
jgi:hypothetical protein